MNKALLRAKVIFPIIAVMLLIPWSVAYAYETSGVSMARESIQITPDVLVTVGNVRVRVRVASSRLLVVDEGENIVKIYSNTRTAAEGSYALTVREGEQYGSERPLSDKIQAQYERLLGKVDWSKTGIVYP